MSQILTQPRRIERVCFPNAEAYRGNAPRQAGSVTFTLFLILNALLIIRPQDFVQDFQIVTPPVYQIMFMICLAVSATAVLNELKLKALADRPITPCVLLMLLAIVLSQLANGYFGGAWQAGSEFAKTVLYYLLILAAVTTPSRLRTFLFAIAVFTSAVTVLAVLQYHGILGLSAFDPHQEVAWDLADWEALRFDVRLRAVGIFNDPNDFGMLLVMSMLISLFGLLEMRTAAAKLFWGVVFAFLGYALTLTQSRGGFLALSAGLAGLSCLRFGWRKTIVFALPVLPLLLMVFGGRQIQVSAGGEGAQGRMKLAWEAMDIFLRSPVFGLGWEGFGERLGITVHNSYVHTFVECGFLGGAGFVGAYFTALYGVLRTGAHRPMRGSTAHQRLRSYLFAIVAAYAVGMVSLSRAYLSVTFLPLGLAAVYMRDTPIGAEGARLRFNGRYALKLFAATLIFLFFLFFSLRLLVQWG